MKKFFSVMLMLASLSANARKFYFSSSIGNDSYTTTQAQNQNTPWASLRKLTQLTTNGTVCFLPGDTIAFKRGDVFANGNSSDSYCSAYFWNDGGNYFTAPSGTPTSPIVITNYGDPSLPLPNWLHPRAYYPTTTWKSREGRGIIEFAGVHDIIIDGIQSDDYRIPASNKKDPGYSGGWIIGEWTKGTNSIPRNSFTDSTRRKNMVTRFIVKNCRFNNTMYGFQNIAAIDSKFMYNSITNLKSTADTAGTHDVGAGAFEGIYGICIEISHNYVKGAWAKSGRIGSCNGLMGVGMDIFNLYNSRIAYNTFIDCSGMIEIGNIDRYDSSSGAQYDTIAYNKVINCSQLAYLHGSAGSPFQGNNHHLAFWNNVCISNNKDRNCGWGFGDDIYNDGQSFTPQFWFYRSKFNTLNVSPYNPSCNTTMGSNVITVSNTTGIVIGSVAFADDDTLLGIIVKTVTVTSINGNQITLSDPCTRSSIGTYAIKFYLPVSNMTWSNPQNSAMNNYSGHRSGFQYSGDNTLWGSAIDTMIDSKNNIFYSTNGVQMVYDRNRLKRSNNIYIPIGSMRYSTSLGGNLNSGERLITTKVFSDTSATYPENWDLHLVDTSYGIGHGLPTPGFTEDFEGLPITNNYSIGLYQKLITIPILNCSFSYGNWSTCNGSYQTRTYTTSPNGCTGTPPIDSIQRTCVSPITISSFYYSSSNKRIYIKCNVAGTMVITNINGSIYRTANYTANGYFINVTSLPSGTYFASTYGRSITFIR